MLVRIQEIDLCASGANHEIIYNSGFLANGDSVSMKVGSDQVSFWQGALYLAFSKYRVALHSINWHGEDGEWKSLLGDPNFASTRFAIRLSPPTF